MPVFLYFILYYSVFCNADSVVTRPPVARPADILTDCLLPRDSKICNPHKVLMENEIRDVEYVLQAECGAIDSIGIYIAKQPADAGGQGPLIRNSIGELALEDWYPDCPLSIFFVIWVKDGRGVCSGFRRLRSPLDPFELKAICDQEIVKNITNVDALRRIILNTRRQVSLRNHKDIVVSLPFWKLCIILIFKGIVLALLVTGICFLYIWWKKFSMKRAMQKDMEGGTVGFNPDAPREQSIDLETYDPKKERSRVFSRRPDVVPSLSEEMGRLESEDEEEEIRSDADLSQLSAEAGGKRSLRSFHGTYLHANESDWTVKMKPAPPGASENWYIEDHTGKVAVKARGGPNKPGQFLRGHPNGTVSLQEHVKSDELWMPRKHDDGTWSLQSNYGQWLSADVDGRVYTVQKIAAWEKFSLERWA